MRSAREMRLKGWWPAFLWAGVIFALSALPDLQSGLRQDFFLRKAAHAVEFGVLALFVARALRRTERWDAKRALKGALVIAVLYAFSDEFHQAFVPGRSAALRDVGVDALGVMVALAFAYARARLARSTT
ncbi:VanZ family protein [Candidatus Parcubacteria bacterium]|nr:VanZ family protein [Candidatus Parcubacteria bacterium]